MSWQSDMKTRLEKINKSRNNSANKLLLFDSDKVDIINYQDIEDEYGITRESWNYVQKDFICDINDMTNDKKEREWGYSLEVDKTMICRYSPVITESCIIRYKDIYYKIQKIKECKNTTLDNFDGYLKIALIKNDEQDINIVESEVDSNGN